MSPLMEKKGHQKKPKIIESATSAVRAESVLGGYLTQLASMVFGAEGWDRGRLVEECWKEHMLTISSTISGSS